METHKASKLRLDMLSQNSPKIELSDLKELTKPIWTYTRHMSKMQSHCSKAKKWKPRHQNVPLSSKCIQTSFKIPFLSQKFRISSIEILIQSFKSSMHNKKWIESKQRWERTSVPFNFPRKPQNTNNLQCLWLDELKIWRNGWNAPRNPKIHAHKIFTNKNVPFPSNSNSHIHSWEIPPKIL